VLEEDLDMVVLKDDGEADRILEGGVPTLNPLSTKNPLSWGIDHCKDGHIFADHA
jgi:hypothetical protein